MNSNHSDSRYQDDCVDYQHGEAHPDDVPNLPKQLPPITEDESQTDSANAQRFLALHRDNVLYVPSWAKWLVWDGRRWEIDQGNVIVEGRAKEVGEMLFEELKHVPSSRQAYAFCKSSGNAGRIRDMLRLARCEVRISHEQFDRDPMLLNVRNGTVDLRTGALREHRQDDWLTALAPVAFDHEAECPTWLGFLDDIFAGNQDLIGYVQRLVGYSLSGDVGQHILPVLYGTGANGKSTLVGAVQGLLGGDYACKAPAGFTMQKKHEQHPTELAMLFSKRLVVAAETEAGGRMAESKVKELTGGDVISARRCREDFWQFEPTHKLWLCTNYKPRLSGTDEAIRRRIKLIPFEVTIPRDKRDADLPKKLAAEASGILNWAIQGALDWRDYGLDEPEEVTEATSGYFAEMDVLGQFLEDYCEEGDYFEEGATNLFETFTQETGERWNQTVFGRRMAERGFVSKMATSGTLKGRKIYPGLRLR